MIVVVGLQAYRVGGNQSSSWMLSGSRSAIRDPSGESAIGLKVMPFSARRPCHASRTSREDTVNAMWSRPVRNSLNVASGCAGYSRRPMSQPQSGAQERAHNAHRVRRHGVDTRRVVGSGRLWGVRRCH